MRIILSTSFFFVTLVALSQCAITVSNTADSGPGSFRQAIIAANACAGNPTITFTIPSNSTITLLSDLPSLTHANTYINGTSAPGYQYPSSMVTLVWPGLDDCIQVDAGNNTIIRGLTFTDNFSGNGDGAFRVQGGNNLLVQYCKSYKSRKNFMRVQGGTNVKVDQCRVQDFWHNGGNSEKGFEVNSGSLIQISNCTISSISKKVLELNNSANGGTNSKVSFYNNTLTNVGYGDSSVCNNLPCGMNKGEHVISSYTAHTTVFSIRNNTLNGTFSKFVELINTKSLNGAGPRDSIYNNSIYNCRGQHTLYIEMNDNNPSAPAGQSYGGIVILNNNFIGDGPNTYNTDQVIEIGGWANNYTSALISGNSIRNYHGRGIMFRFTDNTTISNNRIYNCSKDQAIELNDNCDNVTIQGNILGTDSLNTLGLNLFTGHTIQLNECNNCNIGGNRQLGQGNIIIASNNQKAIEVSGSCFGTTTIQGNDINLNSLGNLALSSSNESAIQINGTTAVIGGDSATFRNRISGGAGGKGIEVSTSGATIEGNLIGCQAGGNTIVGHGLQVGIQLNSGNNTLGSTTIANLLNKIGYCQKGIVNNDQDNNLWSRNLFYGNTGNPVIENQGGSPNNSISPPTITNVFAPFTINGTALPNARVELYFWNSATSCQGYKYLGFTTANAGGAWSFTSPVAISSSIAALQILNNNASQFVCQTVNACTAQISAGSNQTVCSGQNTVLQASGGISYQWNNNVVNGQPFVPQTSGNYIVVGVDANGCSGIDTIVINVLSNSTSTSTQVACGSYPWNGTTYTQSGQYTYQTTNVNGCDSIATLNLTVHSISTSQNNATACDSYSWNGATYTQSGQYTYHTTSIFGCDSTALLNLTINLSSSSTQNQTAVGNYTWPVNGATYTESTTDTATITNAVGCDSTIILVLTIENNGIGDHSEDAFSILTNPSEESVILMHHSCYAGSTFSIYDAFGKCVNIGTIVKDKTVIATNELARGIYVLTIDRLNIQRKFIKL